MNEETYVSTKRLIAFGVLLSIIIVLTACGDYNSWSGTMMSSRGTGNDWSISARTVRGHTVRTVSFTAEELAALRIDSENEDGKISFTMTQGEIEIVTDISGEFNDNIDTSGFEPGRIRLRLDFEAASGVNVTVNWE